jgi:Na+/proline symporter
VPLALGVYWPRGTARAALFAMIIPSVLRLALYAVFVYELAPKEYKGIDTLIPPVVSLILYIGISLLEKPAEKAAVPA